SVWFFLSSPKVLEALMMLVATMATYELLFSMNDFVAKVADLHLPLLFFAILFGLVSWRASRGNWRMSKRVIAGVICFAIAVGAYALLGPTPAGPLKLLVAAAVAINPI